MGVPFSSQCTQFYRAWCDSMRMSIKRVVALNSTLTHSATQVKVTRLHIGHTKEYIPFLSLHRAPLSSGRLNLDFTSSMRLGYEISTGPGRPPEGVSTPNLSFHATRVPGDSLQPCAW